MKEKKITLGLAICIVIIFILIIAIIFLGYFGFINNKNNNNSNTQNAMPEKKDIVKNISSNQINDTEKDKEEITKKDEPQLENDNYAETVMADEAYNEFLEKMSKSTEDFKSTRVDIDNDGIPELIIATGDSEATREAAFYTYKNGEVKDLGTIGMGHSAIYKMNNENYLLKVYGQMGGEVVSKVYIKNGKIQVDDISERQITEEESYTEGDILLTEIMDY